MATSRTTKAAKQPPTVRVTERCKLELEVLASALDLSQTEVLEKAVINFKRTLALKQMAEDYEAIAANQKTAKILANENALFDGATGDGVD